MSYSIAWTTQAYTSFEDRIEYLAIHFSDKEIKNFPQRVKEYLDVLKEEPLIGKAPGKHKNVHIGLIIKPVSIIYRIKTLKKEIELISFIDNRQDPKKIRKYNT
ncbi:MAG: type II toxin-antitoxin system RelE/ParE family toxin [Bacteroidota bacterium]|nr:type II toxin-antitoxin system RelE/ParE family toxin [Bacteroidota bacterium]